jgi:hypothetical protein
VGPLENAKSVICEILTLYTQKYEDLFTSLPNFVSIVWEMLTTMTLQPKNDLVSLGELLHPLWTKGVIGCQQGFKLFDYGCKTLTP